MKKRKFADDGYAIRALLMIAQMGVIRRSELSQALYHENEDGEATSSVGSIGLTRGIKRLCTYGYIDSVRNDEKNYYYVTRAGWEYIQKYYPTVGYRMNELNPNNKNHFKIAERRSIGLYLYRTMGINTLPSEKTSLAKFCNTLAGTYLLDDVECTEGYNQDADVIELFEYGVYYDILEIRDTFLASSNGSMSSIKTSAKGILINAQEVIFVYQMKDKRTVIYPQVENEFVSFICKFLEKVYEKRNGLPEFTKVCNVIASDLRYLPTLVTGKKDGVDKVYSKLEPYKTNRLSNMCVKRLMVFDKIYIVPSIFTHLEYRGNQYDYSDEDYQKDMYRIIKQFPKTLKQLIGPEKTTLAFEESGEDLLICRYPDAKELFLYRLRYIENEKKVSVIGIDDPKIADFISRSLQGAMSRYYSIDTMKEIPIAHYDEDGLKESANGAKAFYIDNLF